MKKKVRKYLLYGVGEIMLIIIGILIALEIDNWNTERQQEALLQSYLRSIANNMREDAVELEQLRNERSARAFAALQSGMLLGRIEYTYDTNEIFFFNKLADDASRNLYFNSNSSGYDALKNSGVIGRLRGSDVETLLSKYYGLVAHIEDRERRLNELLNQLNLQFILSFPSNVTQWNFWAPRAIPPDQFEEMQPFFAQVINGPAIREMVNRQYEGTAIILEYDRLMQLGDAFVAMVDSSNKGLDDAEIEAVLQSDLIQPDRYAEVVVDGNLAHQFYNMSGVAAEFEPIFDFRYLMQGDRSLRVTYPGSDSWAAVFLQIAGFQEDRTVLDFSQFDKLVLELKGDNPNEVLSVHIKDRFLPDWEPPDSVELQLTDDWQTYEIELDKFERTDLKNLITPLGFVFIEKPQSFLIRTARYVKSKGAN